MHTLMHSLTHTYMCAHTLTHLPSFLVGLSWPLKCLWMPKLIPPAARLPRRVPATHAPSNLQPEGTSWNANHTSEGKGRERKN